MNNVIEILKGERRKIDAAINALEGSSTTNQRGPRRRRHMSPEARAKIGARMRALWKVRKAKKAA